MAEQVTVTNMPDSGTSARVAYDLWKTLKDASRRTEDEVFSNYVERRLQLYVSCKNAVDYGTVDVSKLK